MEKIEILKRIEREGDWFAYAPHGWSVWRVLRFAVFRQCDGLGVSVRLPITLTRVSRAGVSLARLLRLCLFRRDINILYKSATSALRIEDNGKFSDTFLDIVLRNRDDFVKLEQVDNENFSFQQLHAAVPVSADPVGINLLSHALAYLSNSDEYVDFCQRVSHSISSRTGVLVQPRNLCHMIKVVLWQERLWALILKRLNPRLLVLTDTGDYGLRLAALKRGVKLIEIQHGLFDASHPDAVPDWVSGDQFGLIEPDYLCVRGAFFENQLHGSRLLQIKVFATGFEPIERCRVARRSYRPHSGARIRFLVTSQGYQQAELCGWIHRLIKASPKDVQVSFRIKLHPLYDRDNFFPIARDSLKNVEVIPGHDRRSVYDLLADSDANISISSATHYDAVAVGVPSFILPLNGHEFVSGSADGVSLVLVREASDVWNALAANRAVGVDLARQEFFCARGGAALLEERIQGWLS